jgi:hypothetical protein
MDLMKEIQTAEREFLEARSRYVRRLLELADKAGPKRRAAELRAALREPEQPDLDVFSCISYMAGPELDPHERLLTKEAIELARENYGVA